MRRSVDRTCGGKGSGRGSKTRQTRRGHGARKPADAKNSRSQNNARELATSLVIRGDGSKTFARPRLRDLSQTFAQGLIHHCAEQLVHAREQLRKLETQLPCRSQKKENATGSINTNARKRET